MSLATVDPTTINFPFTPTPTYSGFQWWVYSFVGVPQDALPNDSIYWIWAYNTATGTVNPLFAQVPGPIYLQMVYNLGMHWLACWAPDVPSPPAPPYKTVDGVNYGYFAWMRQDLNLNGFTPGVVTSTSDVSTSTSLEIIGKLKDLTISQLNLLQTPWGRAYLGLAQDFGSNFGMS